MNRICTWTHNLSDRTEDWLQTLSPTAMRCLFWLLVPIVLPVMIAGAFALAAAFGALWLIVGMFAIELACAVLATAPLVWLVAHCFMR